MATTSANLETEHRIKVIFDEIVEAPVDERPPLLHRLCGSDRSLRERVESLLAAHDAAENFLDPPPPLFGFQMDATGGAAARKPTSEGDDPLIGQHIARYKVTRRLAAGGMGVVYLAEQDQPRRSVALKVMRAGLASRSMLRRFEHEAEVLGQLRHPGIAQIFEAGTFDLGRGAQPYFAMEFIDGRRLTDFAEHHKLTAAARLELLADVCDAVHYAHQKGVVHRDLKPDNILVTAGDEETERRRDEVRGAHSTSSLRLSVSPSHFQPKILDFGVARLTDSDFAVTTLQTDIGQIVGTLPYMSPEQVAGDPSQVDTRSDVYALGVIAYELLTGEVPLNVRHKSMAEAARIIADHEPPALTSFDRVFRGDVSTIVGKALEKDKSRRYQSAWGLGEDIRRYLRHEPISARPATTVYQLRKFARRNKALVAGAIGVVLMLVLGVIGTSIGLVQARESASLARKQETAAKASALEAQQQRAAAEQVSRFLQQMLSSITPSTALGRDTALLREILDSAAARVDRELAAQPDIAATLHGVIGRTYASISEYPSAIVHLRLALDLRRKVAGDAALETAKAQGDLGRALYAANQFDEAQPLLEAALATTRSAAGSDDVAVARAMNDLANLLRSRGDYAQAENMLREAREMLLRQGEADDSPSLLRATNDLANVLLTRRKFEEALPLFQATLEARQRAGSPDSPDLALAEANMARVLSSLRRRDEALPHMQRALAIHRKVLPPGHSTLNSTIASMANLQYQLQQFDQADALLNEALHASEERFGSDSAEAAGVLAMQANFADAQRDIDTAEKLCIRALEIRRRVLPADHPDIAESLRQLSGIRGQQNRHEETIALLREALVIQRVRGASDYEACQSIMNLATYESMYGDQEKAVTLARDALRMLTDLLGDDSPPVTGAKARVAKFLTDVQRYDEALPLRMDVLARTRADPKESAAEIGGVADEAGSLLNLMGRFAEAEPLLRESLELRRRELPADHFAPGRSLIRLGACLVGLQRYSEAEPILLEGEAIWTKYASGSPLTSEARQSLADLYLAIGNPEESAKWKAKVRKPARARTPAPATQPQPATAPAST